MGINNFDRYECTNYCTMKFLVLNDTARNIITPELDSPVGTDIGLYFLLYYVLQFSKIYFNRV